MANGSKGLWSRWAQQNFLKGVSVWNIKPKQDDPWTWKKLMKIRQVMYEHIITVVDDGRDTMLFYDNWLPCGNLAKFMGDDIHVWRDNVRESQGGMKGEVGSYLLASTLDTLIGFRDMQNPVES